ncbi:hypothetical protein Tco_0371635 [Tanacetum coccineum]
MPPILSLPLSMPCDDCDGCVTIGGVRLLMALSRLAIADLSPNLCVDFSCSVCLPEKRGFCLFGTDTLGQGSITKLGMQPKLGDNGIALTQSTEVRESFSQFQTVMQSISVPEAFPNKKPLRALAEAVVGATWSNKNFFQMSVDSPDDSKVYEGQVFKNSHEVSGKSVREKWSDALWRRNVHWGWWCGVRECLLAVTKFLK